MIKDSFWKSFESGETYNIYELSDPIQEGIEIADDICKRGYAPYYKYHVGTVITTSSKKRYSGCNNAICNGDSVCAEAAAVSDWTKSGCSIDSNGKVVRETIDYVIVRGTPTGGTTMREDVFVTPCGRCRQRLYEFCSGDVVIIGCNETLTRVKVYKLSDLLPDAYTPDNLK